MAKNILHCCFLALVSLTSVLHGQAQVPTTKAAKDSISSEISRIPNPCINCGPIALSQPPCPAIGIRTNPLNYYVPEHPVVRFDPANPFTQSPFNWVNPISPRLDEYNIYWSRQSPSVAQTFPTPFNQFSNNPPMDFKKRDPDTPEKGWELIRMDLGYNDDGSVRSTCINPFVIIYNKYLGTLRVYYAVGATAGTYDYSRMDLTFAPPSGTITRKTGALNHLTGIGTPLANTNPGNTDKFSVVNKFNNSAQGGIGSWFMADFPMDYDPCTCLYESQFQLEIRLIETSHITMQGTVNGTITSIDNKKSSGDNFPDGSSFRQTLAYANGGLKSAFGSFNGIIDFLKTTPGGAGLTSFPVTGNILTAVESAAKTLDYFINGVPPTGPMAVTVQPMTIQAAIKLEGDIVTTGYWGGTNFRVPGSKTPPPVTGVSPAVTPYYNEVTGIFNLLTTPVVKTSSSFISIPNSPAARVKRFYQFDNDLVYVVNPAAGMRIVGMRAALVETTSKGINPVSSNTLPGVTNNTGFIINEGGSGSITIPDGFGGTTLQGLSYTRTGYVNAGCLKNYEFNDATGIVYYTQNGTGPLAFAASPYDLRIKLLIDFVRNDNGEHVLLVTTYPVDIISSTVANPMTVRSNLDCSNPIPTPQSAAEITAFCTSNATYNGSVLLRQGQNPKGSRLPGQSKPSASQNHFTQFGVFPNPVTESSVIRFAVEEKSSVHLFLRNELGQTVREFLKQEMSPGLVEQPLDAAELKSGIYFCTLLVNNQLQTLKIVVIK